MKYLIGMDGGGTKTKCILTDFDFNPICETTGGPSNFLMLGNEKVADSIFNLINYCVETQKISFLDIEGIILGTTGGGRRSDAESLENSINQTAKSKNIELKNFRVESDARIALEGAFSGKPGSILIAGTGSIMFGKDANGDIHRVGGFGRFLGDEGSGFRIGQKALNLVSRNFDGRGKETKIKELLLEKFSISSVEILITEVYRNNFDIAAVAPLVIEAAEKGDKPAQRILEDESEELILHIHAMKSKLLLPQLKVSLIGSLITTANYFSYLFNEKVVRNFNDVLIKEAEYPPEIGAVLMAKSLIS